MDQDESKSPFNQINSDYIIKEDEIDFAEIFKSIRRNKKLFLYFVFLA